MVLITALLAISSVRTPETCDTVHRIRLEFRNQTEFMSERDFKQCHRLSRTSFRNLLDMLWPRLHRLPRGRQEEETRRHITGAEIQVATKLAVFLRTMSGGSY